MSQLTKTRILLLVIFLMPVVVMALFWLFGNSPPDPADTLPLMPPR